MDNTSKKSIVNKLVIYYYHMLGYKPSKDKVNKTRLTITYLLEAKVDKEYIYNMIKNMICIKDEFIGPDLPDVLWSKSLLKKDTFYFHKELQIECKSNVIDMSSKNFDLVSEGKFYKEMIINFSELDLLSYCRKKLKIRDTGDFNNKRDIGFIKHVLEKYEKISSEHGIEPIDILLQSIDTYSREDDKYKQIVVSSNYLNEALDMLEIKKSKVNRSVSRGKIVWRM